MTEGDAVTLYSYDGRGNMILEESGTGEIMSEMTYLVTGEMKSLDKYSGESISLTQENVYDHEGIRISSTEAGTKRSYYYDQGSVSFTMDGGNLSGANVLSGTGAVIGTFRGDDYHIYLKDMQGSTTNIVKEDGTLSAAYDYSDFGETTEITGSGFDNEICYTGGIYDEGTELYYLNARYYDPELGRFIRQDSYRGELNDPNQWHLYAYCANDPINYVDPSGHWVISIWKHSVMNTTGTARLSKRPA
jgi:RHS repeat-associated protein